MLASQGAAQVGRQHRHGHGVRPAEREGRVGADSGRRRVDLKVEELEAQLRNLVKKRYC